MSKDIFYRLVIGLAVTCLVGTQGLYAQDVTRYETKGKGAWERASSWEIVTRDSRRYAGTAYPPGSVAGNARDLAAAADRPELCVRYPLAGNRQKFLIKE